MYARQLEKAWDSEKLSRKV